MVLDVDSTLCGIEGIDWLAARRGGDVAERVALETEMSMRGEIPLEAVYGRRLSLVKPSREEIWLLAELYQASLAEGAVEFISKWSQGGIVVALLTGGIRQAILPLAMRLGIPEDRVHAVDIQFDDVGSYVGFDHTSPLTTAMGKRDILGSLSLPRPMLTVGDGSTDLATRDVADAFAAFTGFAARGPVVRRADFVAASFKDLDAIVNSGI